MKNDAVTLLRDNHQLLCRLMRQLRSCASAEQARVFFKQFSLALGGQLGGMNKVIYPALKSLGWAGVRSDMLVGHAKLAQGLAEVLTLKPDSGHFADALSDLLDATTFVLDQEAEHLLPLLERRFDGAQRLALALDIEPYLAAGSEADQLDPLYMTDWLEEARLILGGLQAVPADAAVAVAPSSEIVGSV
jgi:hypothetical protein